MANSSTYEYGEDSEIFPFFILTYFLSFAIPWSVSLFYYFFLHYFHYLSFLQTFIHNILLCCIVLNTFILILYQYNTSNTNTHNKKHTILTINHLIFL